MQRTPTSLNNSPAAANPDFRLSLREQDIPGDPRHPVLELVDDQENSGPIILEEGELDELVALLKGLIG
jgi:hypothetical protein